MNRVFFWRVGILGGSGHRDFEDLCPIWIPFPDSEGGANTERDSIEAGIVVSRRQLEDINCDVVFQGFAECACVSVAGGSFPLSKAPREGRGF
jgi:hypothetical protein